MLRGGVPSRPRDRTGRGEGGGGGQLQQAHLHAVLLRHAAQEPVFTHASEGHKLLWLHVQGVQLLEHGGRRPAWGHTCPGMSMRAGMSNRRRGRMRRNLARQSMSGSPPTHRRDRCSLLASVPSRSKSTACTSGWCPSATGTASAASFARRSPTLRALQHRWLLLMCLPHCIPTRSPWENVRAGSAPCDRSKGDLNVLTLQPPTRGAGAGDWAPAGGRGLRHATRISSNQPCCSAWAAACSASSSPLNPASSWFLACNRG